jgi:hypothetical protein
MSVCPQSEVSSAGRGFGSGHLRIRRAVVPDSATMRLSVWPTKNGDQAAVAADVSRRCG